MMKWVNKTIILLFKVLDEDIEKFTKELSDYLIFTSSYHDFGNQEKEKSYHLFFLGLVASK